MLDVGCPHTLYVLNTLSSISWSAWVGRRSLVLDKYKGFPQRARISQVLHIGDYTRHFREAPRNLPDYTAGIQLVEWEDASLKDFLANGYVQ